jgi:hypothetical protein
LTNRDPKHVFIGDDGILAMQKELFAYADLLCPGGILGVEGFDGPLTLDDYDQYYIQPITEKCTPDGVSVDVRTKNPFNGQIFAIGYEDREDCQVKGQGETKTNIVLRRGKCGMKIEPKNDGTSYTYEVKFGIRYHSFLHTRVDQMITVNCEIDDVYDPTVDQILKSDSKHIDLDNNLLIADVKEASCEYNIKNPFGGCSFLDAKVGTLIEHEWKCSLPIGHRFMVHDCVVESEDPRDEVLNVLSSEGCQIDEVLLQTPKYNANTPNRVTQRSTSYKFTYGNSMRFQCLVSICDMSNVLECKYMFQRSGLAAPVACKNEGPLYEARRLASSPIDYSNPPKNDRFAKTLSVTTRVINVYQKSEFISQLKKKSKAPDFCSTLN